MEQNDIHDDYKRVLLENGTDKETFEQLQSIVSQL